MNAHVKPITAVVIGVWTEQALATLRKMHSEGYTARDIANQIPGATRNAVLGKIHRLQGGRISNRTWTPEQDAYIVRMALDGKTCSDTAKALHKAKSSILERAEQLEVKFAARGVSPKTYKPRVAQGPIKVTPARQDLLDSPAPGARLLSLFDLKPGQCKWPLGDPKEETFAYCGADRPLGKSFCDHHHAIAYQPGSVRRTVKRAEQTSYSIAHQRHVAALANRNGHW